MDVAERFQYLQMKLNWTTGLVSELIRSEKVIDQSAETVKEISDKTGRPTQRVSDRIREHLATGKLEQVWKTYNGKLCKAYRLKHKPTTRHK